MDGCEAGLDKPSVNGRYLGHQHAKNDQVVGIKKLCGIDFVIDTASMASIKAPVLIADARKAWARWSSPLESLSTRIAMKIQHEGSSRLPPC
jgi:hypothetical protein